MKIIQKITKIRASILFAIFIFFGLASFGTFYALSANNKTSLSSQKNCADICVALYEDKALPSTIAVTVGSYVQFNSADGKSHNLSIGQGGLEHEHTGKFYSGEFKADEAWRVQFKEEGSFYFHDHFNPKISILVVVYTQNKQYKVE